MVSTAHPGIATSTTSTIVERILNVCKELGVSLSAQRVLSRWLSRHCWGRSLP